MSTFMAILFAVIFGFMSGLSAGKYHTVVDCKTKGESYMDKESTIKCEVVKK